MKKDTIIRLKTTNRLETMLFYRYILKHDTEGYTELSSGSANSCTFFVHNAEFADKIENFINNFKRVEVTNNVIVHVNKNKTFTAQVVEITPKGAFRVKEINTENYSLQEEADLEVIW